MGSDRAWARKQSQELVGVTTVYEDVNICERRGRQHCWGAGPIGKGLEYKSAVGHGGNENPGTALKSPRVSSINISRKCFAFHINKDKFTWEGKLKRGGWDEYSAYLVNPQWHDKTSILSQEIYDGSKNLHIFKLPSDCNDYQLEGLLVHPYQIHQIQTTTLENSLIIRRNTWPLWSSNSSQAYTHLCCPTGMNNTQSRLLSTSNWNNSISISIKMNKLTEVYPYKSSLLP